MARHSLLALLAIGLLGSPACGQEAKILATAPDVDVRRANSRSWEPAEEGMAIAPGDVVATGYRSQAVLAFEDNAYMLVLPMSQVQLEQHGTGGNKKSQTRVFLRLGSVRAKVPRRSAAGTELTIATPAGKVAVGPVESQVTHDEEFGTRVETISGRARARARLDGEVPVRSGQSARLVEKRARGPREHDKERLAPDLVPPGSDEAEREATRDYDRVDHRPIPDATSANSIQEVAGAATGDSSLVFRYQVVTGE